MLSHSVMSNSAVCCLSCTSVHGDSPGKDTGEGCQALFQRIFATQGLNPGLQHFRWILYHLSHLSSPRILDVTAYLMIESHIRHYSHAVLVITVI